MHKLGLRSAETRVSMARVMSASMARTDLSEALNLSDCPLCPRITRLATTRVSRLNPVMKTTWSKEVLRSGQIASRAYPVGMEIKAIRSPRASVPPPKPARWNGTSLEK